MLDESLVEEAAALLRKILDERERVTPPVPVSEEEAIAMLEEFEDALLRYCVFRGFLERLQSGELLGKHKRKRGGQGAAS